MTDRIIVDRMFNAGTESKPVYRRLRYMVSGQNLRDSFGDDSAHEVAVKKTAEMLKKTSV